ncbi:hypothetical protein F8568_044220 [Actinomadura sp. LD22]|uniref:Uncharacterized protein n=1 Tax=Actinomadura physcomitrii TaxID=2650748 RepID=A0A6I4MTD6_9ACTN|nr:hypothetical protein [Actinomadura physcomitrii]MWA07224.1 hypothetical protein [Actinomadura physcomitrii]
MAFTTTFITGTRDLPEDGNGTGSALITTAQYTGGSIGLAPPGRETPSKS